jgi:hypothetical protein
VTTLVVPHDAGVSAWDTIRIGGVTYTGVVKVSGDGLKKKIDKRKAAGADGARIVDKGFDLADFTIRLEGWLPEHGPMLERIMRMACPRGPSVGAHARVSQPIEYPSLAACDITEVYFTRVPLPEPEDGRLVVTLHATEFREPPPRNATRRPRPAAPINDLDPQIAAAFRNNPIPRPSASGAAAPVPAPPSTP